MAELEPAERDFVERAWQGLSRWAVPVMMAIAYSFLAATSDTNLVGKAWMSAGFGLVLIAWFVFRALTESAALSRAIAVGDVARLFELADRKLARKRRPAVRARFLVARAFAHELRGDHAAALAALEEARPGPPLVPLAHAVRITALVELGRPVEQARGWPVVAPRTPALAWLAEAQLAWRAGELDRAAPLLARVIDDIRAGSASRAIAHVYAARIAEAGGDAAAATRHRSAAAALAAPDATWLHDQIA